MKKTIQLILSVMLLFLINNMGHAQSALNITYKPRVFVCAKSDTVEATFTCNFNGKVSYEILKDGKKWMKILKYSEVKSGSFKFIYSMDAVAPDSIKIKWTIEESDDPTGCALKGATVTSKLLVDCKCDPMIEVIELQDESCFGCKDGVVTVSAYGMEEPITYLWSNGDTGPFVTDLAPGDYFVAYQGANTKPCVDTLFFTIKKYLCDKTSIRYKYDNVSCNNACNGSIEIERLENGKGVRTVEWGDGTKGKQRDSLCAGSYLAIAMGFDNCIYREPIDIIQPDSLMLDTIEVVDTAGSGSGIIRVKASGGTPSYHFFIAKDGVRLMHNDSSNVFTGLEKGCYDLSVEDMNKCERILSNICIKGTNASVEVEKPDFSITPNPSSGIFKVNGNISGIKYVSISSISGKEIKRVLPNKVLDFRSVGTGLFIIKMVTNTNSVAKRVIIVE